MMLKRSVVEQNIELAKATFNRFGIQLPPFAFWSADDWKARSTDVDEIRHCRLGWDVTDFGSGNFEKIGRTLFTLRNGHMRGHRYPKFYAEKLILNPEGQHAPAHYHRSKMEDITHRAGGCLMVRILGEAAKDGLVLPVERIQIDGQTIKLGTEGRVCLKPGQSICIPPLTIHQFCGDGELGVSSEVSSVCNDEEDNIFLEPAVRYPALEEDQPRKHYLCHEYPFAISDHAIESSKCVGQTRQRLTTTNKSDATRPWSSEAQ
jgi:D-lyxose ketol-isomerase